jgi:hypothetical protein
MNFDELRRFAEVARDVQGEIDAAGLGKPTRTPIATEEFTIENITEVRTTAEGDLEIVMEASPAMEITLTLTSAQVQELARHLRLRAWGLDIEDEDFGVNEEPLSTYHETLRKAGIMG